MVRPGIGFTGAIHDPLTSAYPLGDGYRCYLPSLMRFNAPDDDSPFDTGGPNPYAYCDDDPVNRLDPSGHSDVPNLSLQIFAGVLYFAVIFAIGYYLYRLLRHADRRTVGNANRHESRRRTSATAESTAATEVTATSEAEAEWLGGAVVGWRAQNRNRLITQSWVNTSRPDFEMGPRQLNASDLATASGAQTGGIFTRELITASAGPSSSIDPDALRPADVVRITPHPTEAPPMSSATGSAMVHHSATSAFTGADIHVRGSPIAGSRADLPRSSSLQRLPGTTNAEAHASDALTARPRSTSLDIKSLPRDFFRF